MGLEFVTNKNNQWLLVFIPALIYFIVLRTSHHAHTQQQPSVLNDIFGLKPYVPIGTEVLVSAGHNGVDGLKEIQSKLYLSDASKNEPSGKSYIPLLYPLEVVIDDSERIPSKYHSTAFVHDSDLGRGYVLISDSHGAGRIWRWEVGGGPITIGKSLHQVNSGCRSKSKCSMEDGSRGMVVQWEKGAELPNQAGDLVVAEVGERRIVRIEKETGSRTPLVLNMPCGEEQVRLQQADWLLLTPQGDLIFTATSNACSKDSIYQLNAAAHVPPIIPSLSRQAHGWNKTHHSHPIEVIYTAEDDDTTSITGLTLDVTDDLTASSTLYFTVVSKEHVFITKSVLEIDDDEDQHGSSQQFFDMTPFFTANNIHLGSAITLDKTGTLYATYPGGIAIISKSGDLLAQIPFQPKNIHLNSITLASDGYIYATTTDSQLVRLRTKAEPIKIPTDKYKPIDPTKKT